MEDKEISYVELCLNKASEGQLNSYQKLIRSDKPDVQRFFEEYLAKIKMTFLMNQCTLKFYLLKFH